MSKDYLLGIDIGTSACKVAIFNKNGKVMASANGDYPVYYPHEGWAQQKPDEWWHAVCGAICECLETGNISGEQIAGVGIDGQSWSAIAIDHEGNVLTDTPIWMDTRAQEICDRLNNEIGSENIFTVFTICGKLHIGVHRKQLLLAFLILNKIPGSFCKNQNSNTNAGCRQYFSFHKDLFSLAYSVGVLPVIFLKEIPK